MVDFILGAQIPCIHYWYTVLKINLKYPLQCHYYDIITTEGHLGF